MFKGRLRYFALKAWQSIWFRPAAYSLLALLAVAGTPLIGPLVPDDWAYEVDVQVVDRVLDILTASMLAVAIFSLSTMVTQLNAAAQAATPRTRPLLAQDRTAQNAISTFIGTFLFGVLGVIGIQLDLYDQTGLFLLFCLSILLIGLVVVNLVLWIRRLSAIGGVGEAMERVEHAADEAFAAAARDPWFGGQQIGHLPDDLDEVKAPRTGFIQTIDGAQLGRVADELDTPLYLLARPGDFVDPTKALAMSDALGDEAIRDKIREAFVIGNDRDFRSDPRYGVLVLSEIASRALSPGINDPGTAIDVIGTLVRLLSDWRGAARKAEPECRHPNLRVSELDPGHVLVDAFRGIARDGAGMVEVGLRLQHALGTLSRLDAGAFAEPARRLADEHLDRAREAMAIRRDVEVLEEAHREAMEGDAHPGGPRTGEAEAASARRAGVSGGDSATTG